jgi:microcystin-dependent protein
MAFTIPNTIETGSEIQSAEHEQNYTAVETDLNTNVIRKDGSVVMTGELGLSGNPVSNLGAVPKQYVDMLMPIQFAFPCFSPAAPTGYTFPVGQTVARTSAPLMAAAIAPDASSPYWVDATNFKYPDMRDRVLVGKGTVKTVLDAKFGSKDAIVVSHTHTGPSHTHTWSGTSSSNGYHTHGLGGQGILYNDSVYGGYAISPTGYVRVSAGFNSSDSGAHTHTMSGTTAAAGTGATGSTGSTGTDANYQPSLVCNWAMRLA